MKNTALSIASHNSELFGTSEEGEEHEDRLSPAQIAALDALLTGQSQAKAAAAAGKSPRWLWNQMHDYGPFRKVYDRAIQFLAREVRATALNRATEVIENVSRIAVDPAHKDCLKAAQIILQLTRKR